jgi:iron complex outermembrane receptor protein
MLLLLAGGLLGWCEAFAQLEEVVVTATRREESIQSVPIAVTALTADQLGQAQIEGVRDLPFETPGLEMANRATAWVPYIRGIGTLDVSAGQESAIATYIDGVYLASVYGASFMSFNNIERVEVLKGPQGTLFGRNATGGAIQVITRDPTHDPTLDAKISYGDYQTTAAQLYASNGFGSMLAGDVALTYSDQDQGYGRNVFTGGETELQREFGVRTKWLFTPSDLTKITVTADYGKRRSGIGDNRTVLPGSVSLGGYTSLPNFQDVNQNYPSSHFIENGGVAARIQQSFDFADFNSITAYRKLHGLLSFDNDGIPLSIVQAREYEVTRTLTQELQLLSKSDSSIKWILGAFFMNNFDGYVPPGGLLLSGDGVAPEPVSVGFVDHIATKSYAVYAESTVPLPLDTRLTLGARWTHDKKELAGALNVFADNTPGPLLSSSAIGPLDAVYQKPTWRVSLDHDLRKNFLVYASYNRGFRSGTFNTVSPSNGSTVQHPVNPDVQPETDDTFEVGEKTELFDRRLQLDSAAFYTLYKQLQVTIPLGGAQAVLNAGKAKTYGLEMEARAAVASQVHANLGFSYLHATFVEFGGADGAPCTTRDASGATLPTVCFPAGNRLPRAPDYTFNAGVDYGIPTPVGNFTTNLYYMWTAHFFWEPDNRLVEPAYGLLNGTLSWTDTRSHYTVSLWSRNLTNTKYSTFTVAQAGINDQYDPAPPRTYGMSLRVRF